MSYTTLPSVLIVDDDLALLEVYHMALTDLGFSVISAANGLEALRKASTTKPSLILVDQRMPGLTGTEFARQVRDMGLSDVPIVLVSAGRNMENEAQLAGVTRCLEKPFDVNELIDIVMGLTQPRAAFLTA